jgi:hypothetical protein
MKTIIVNVPDKDESLFEAMVKKMGFKSRTINDNEREEKALAKWIDEGMATEDVAEETVFATLKRHGVKI